MRCNSGENEEADDVLFADHAQNGEAITIVQQGKAVRDHLCNLVGSTHAWDPVDKMAKWK